MDQPAISIVEAMLDPAWFGSFFITPETWTNWMAFFDVFQGQELTADELAAYQKFTGREKYEPGEPFDTAFVISGRRSGKSRAASVVAVYLALLSGLHRNLSPGEVGWVLVIASKREQAQVIFQYVRALAAHFPKEIKKETADTVEFNNGAAIKITSGSWRGVRGNTLIGCLIDEISFLRSEDETRFVANPAEQLLRAIRPAIMRNGKLLAISTPYSARGVLYNAWRKHYGKDSRTLVWRSDTVSMNPTFSQATIDDEMEEDRPNAMSEYYSEWREDLQTLIESSLVRAAMCREEMPPQPGLRYSAFLDLSGNKSDSHALAIVHKEGDRVIVDTMMEIEAAKGSVDYVVKEFSELALAFGIREISADAFGSEWAGEPFRKAGTPLIKSVMPASNLFLNAAQLIRSGKCDLVYSEKLLNQFASLDRRPGPAGVDSVQKIPGSKVDLCNAVCGALVTAAIEVVRQPMLPIMGHHAADKLMTPSLAAGRRREEIRQSCEDEMREFMVRDGGNQIVRPGMRGRWTERPEHQVGETVNVAGRRNEKSRE